MNELELGRVLLDAHTAGQAAADACEPQMMRVKDRRTGRVYDPFPICGFASVHVKGARGKLLQGLKARGFRRDSYRGGVYLWISDFGQSYDLKAAYALQLRSCSEGRGVEGMV